MTDGRAQPRGVLPDARREDDRVEAAERHRIRADVLAQPVGGDVEGEPAVRVVLGDELVDLAEVVGAAQSLEPALPVEGGVDVTRRSSRCGP